MSNNVVRDITPKDRSTAFLVFAFLFACYLLTYTGYIDSSDGLSTFATTESLVRTRRVRQQSAPVDGESTGQYRRRRRSLYAQRVGHDPPGSAAGLACPALARARACPHRIAGQPLVHGLDGRTDLSCRATPGLAAIHGLRHGTALWPGYHGLALHPGLFQ